MYCLLIDCLKLIKLWLKLPNVGIKQLYDYSVGLFSLCIFFFRGQWTSWIRNEMPADVLPALCIPLHWDDSSPSCCSHISFTWVPCWHSSSLHLRTSSVSLCLSSCPVSRAFTPSPHFRPNCWVPVSRSGPVTLECRPPEVRLQRWYLPEHSAHPSCHDNAAHELRKMRKSWQPNKKRKGKGNEGGKEFNSCCLCWWIP